MKVFVMDHTGHSTLEFTDAQRAEGLALLAKCLSEGGTAGTRKTGASEYTQVKRAGQVEDELLLIPQRQGG